MTAAALAFGEGEAIGVHRHGDGDLPGGGERRDRGGRGAEHLFAAHGGADTIGQRRSVRSGEAGKVTGAVLGQELAGWRGRGDRDFELVVLAVANAGIEGQLVAGIGHHAEAFESQS